MLLLSISEASWIYSREQHSTAVEGTQEQETPEASAASCTHSEEIWLTCMQ